MSPVIEIERAIARLSPEEFLDFERWFDEERNRKWDRQIEGDVRSGRLREAHNHLQSENQGQPEVSLDKVLDDEEL